MNTSKILPFRALAVGECFMYGKVTWTKISSTHACCMGAAAEFDPNTPIEC